MATTTSRFQIFLFFVAAGLVIDVQTNYARPTVAAG